MKESIENTLLEQLKLAKGRKVAFWGASTFLLSFLANNNIDFCNVIGVIDNNKNLENSTFLRYQIYNPKNIIEKPDYIIYTIQHNFEENYKKINEQVKLLFPNAILLPNIFTAKTKLEQIASNKIYLLDEKGEKHLVSYIPGLDVRFYGYNSIIEIGANPLPKFKNCIIMCGDNSYTKIDSSNFSIRNAQILVVANNSKLVIGKNFSLRNGLRIYLTNEPDCSIIIGDDCMFSSDIIIRACYAHALYNKDTKAILNKPWGVKIGNHVWCGQNTFILKNTKIKNNCVIGAQSLVNRTYDMENAVIAGNPAKIIKQNINWDRATIAKFEREFS